MTSPHSAATLDYAIPERSGEVLIAPPLDRVPALLGDAQAARWDGAQVLGVPLIEVRRRTRARALALAAEYTGRPAGTPDRPLVVMGHQPVLFHPGVWIKYFVLTRLTETDERSGLHLIVDTDATGPIAADVPAQHDGLVRVRETLVDLAPNVPLEAVPVPGAETWAAFAGRVRTQLATVPLPGLVGRFDAYAAGAEQAAEAAPSLGGFLARLRRHYEASVGEPGYLELPMSQLADTPEFRAFALHLLLEPDELLRSYNAHLDTYREAHRLRSAANPFPNLTRGCGRIEAPFWVVRDGVRRELHVARSAGRLVLTSGTDPLATIPADPSGVDALAECGVALRPKAMMLTMFIRLCLGDLFIHGIGGGRYDRVTDVIAADLFGCRPTPYVVATATLHLPLPGEAAGGERRALEHRVMDLHHNPDRHLDAMTDAQRRLVDEKWALIRAVGTLGPGPERRTATRRIRELNASLAADLASEIADADARLARLDASRAEAVAGYREYPFCLFDPAEVAALAGIPHPPA